MRPSSLSRRLILSSALVSVVLLAATGLLLASLFASALERNFDERLRAVLDGVLANLAAMPVVSGLVMPARLLGLAAMPFGLDGVFWNLMGLGIDWMIVVTVWVAALPGAIGRMAAFGTGPLVLATTGIVLLGLLRTLLRWAGAGALVAATLWAVMVPQPDILVSSDGHSVVESASCFLR